MSWVTIFHPTIRNPKMKSITTRLRWICPTFICKSLSDPCSTKNRSRIATNRHKNVPIRQRHQLASHWPNHTVVPEPDQDPTCQHVFQPFPVFYHLVVQWFSLAILWYQHILCVSACSFKAITSGRWLENAAWDRRGFSGDFKLHRAKGCIHHWQGSWNEGHLLSAIPIVSCSISGFTGPLPHARLGGPLYSFQIL